MDERKQNIKKLFQMLINLHKQKNNLNLETATIKKELKNYELSAKIINCVLKKLIYSHESKEIELEAEKIIDEIFS